MCSTVVGMAPSCLLQLIPHNQSQLSLWMSINFHQILPPFIWFHLPIGGLGMGCINVGSLGWSPLLCSQILLVLYTHHQLWRPGRWDPPLPFPNCDQSRVLVILDSFGDHCFLGSSAFTNLNQHDQMVSCCLGCIENAFLRDHWETTYTNRSWPYSRWNVYPCICFTEFYVFMSEFCRWHVISVLHHRHQSAVYHSLDITMSLSSLVQHVHVGVQRILNLYATPLALLFCSHTQPWHWRLWIGQTKL